MQRTTLVAISLTLLVGPALWQHHHLVGAKAASLYSTLTVTNTADSGVGSLRQAIADANLTVGTDTITFEGAVFGTPQTITLTSGELAISDSVTINGPGASVLTISGNSSSRIFFIGPGNHDVTLFGLTVINGRHTAPGGGGGILNFSSGTLTLANSALSGNSSNGLGANHGSGGGIFNAGNGAVALINTTVSDNSANGLASVDVAFGQGGGIFNAGDGTVTLTNSILSGNSANGAVFGFGFGFGEGGGIFNAGNGTVTLTNTTLSSNSANSSILPGRGGGIFNASTGTVTLINTTLSDNEAIGSQGFGGGIANSDGTVTLTNSTLSGNSGTGGATGKGGGVYNSGNGTVTLTNSTLTGNFVSGLIQSEGGGIFSEGAGTVSARNSLIASNSSGILAPDVRGTFISQGHNLIGDGTGSSGFTGMGDQVGTSSSVINARLAPLGNNGGPTQTRALLPGSPAIDTGDNCVIQNPGCLATPLSTDQRGAGFPRNSGSTVDIGAFEQVLIQYEADVAPRPNGSGTVVVSDWVQVGRFSVGLDTVVQGSEAQRADCAPRATLGDGQITVADWVQAGRYSVGLDPVIPAGGPTLISALPVNRKRFGPSRDLQIASHVVTADQGLVSLPVELVALGGENGLTFSVHYDPSVLSYRGYEIGTDVRTDTTVLENAAQVGVGRIGFGVVLRPGIGYEAGVRGLVRVKFKVLNPGVGMTEVRIGDGPTPLGLVDLHAVGLSARPVNRMVNVGNLRLTAEARELSKGMCQNTARSFCHHQDPSRTQIQEATWRNAHD